MAAETVNLRSILDDSKRIHRMNFAQLEPGRRPYRRQLESE
jgi:hypothetical protein